MQIVLWILSVILLSSMNETTWWIYWAGMVLLLICIVLSRMAGLSRILRSRKLSLEEPEVQPGSPTAEDEVMSA